MAALLANFQPSLAETSEFDTYAGMAIELDRLYETIDDEYKVGITNQYEMETWMREIVPYFEYEGMVIEGLAKYPDVIEFEYYQDGQSHNHVLGRTHCINNEMSLNARYANPYSSLYDDVGSLSTLIHELAHIQGICYRQDHPDKINSESSANLVTFEILAAMANKGNKYALTTLVDDLRGLSLSSAWYVARAEGLEEQYDKLLATVNDDPFEMAKSEKSQRRWESDPERLTEILHDYSYVPLVTILDGFNEGEIPGVHLPVNWSCDYITSFYVGSYYGVDENGNEKTECVSEPLIIDDLAYVIAHMDELVGAI
jgi:hypothetical protein